jgi:hypothetical protein
MSSRKLAGLADQPLQRLPDIGQINDRLARNRDCFVSLAMTL